MIKVEALRIIELCDVFTFQNLRLVCKLFYVLSKNRFGRIADWKDFNKYECIKLSESFIIKFQTKVNWYWISIEQTLSEPFIKRFQHKVNWACISIHQTLSESFIIEFQDKLYWNLISRYQTLSKPFIEKFKHKL